ncbi:hypothetical protein EWM64_g8539 [Hericium alpestre]|uniref:CxC1-like cysteine cluster associated with KDZ transposases domain-containing protein n=1 Tax=Hericium alpestre TaxID=135208 RepID=A0A4Y9ZMI5_9AGAM|nr:hypothetical protein EWM64_g8539 [Hericium alpestre]
MGKIKTRLRVRSTFATANGTLCKKVKTGSKIAAESEEMLHRRAQDLQALPTDVRRAITREVESNGAAPDDLAGLPMEVDNAYGGGEWAYEDEDSDVEPPDISHEGGEYADRVRAAFELTNAAQGKHKYSRPWDARSRRERLRALQRNWEAEMPALVDAYLQWKHSDAVEATGHQEPGREGSDGREAGVLSGGPSGHHPDGMQADSRHNGGQHDDEPTEPGSREAGTDAVHVEMHGRHVFHVCAVSTFERNPCLPIIQCSGEPANVSLIRAGYLGCAPQQPSVAFDLHTLELYHRLRRRHSGLGLLPMARALCDLHDVDYRASLREQFSIAFDAYLDILRRVKCMVDCAIGRSDPLWHVKNSCPPCSFKLKDEPALVPSHLGCIDGNNSAKRVASAGTEDERNFVSSYFLTREQVDKYKDEVKGRRSASEAELDAAESDAPWAPDPDSPGDPTDGDAVSVTPCTERWKASAAEHTKKALDVYDITGIFGGSCHHGLIALFCEMVRSGELAKYPLAIVDHQLDAHDDDDEANAFDIGEEEKFLQDLKEEPEERVLECAYVEALISRVAADKKWQKTSQVFVDTPLMQSSQGTQAYRNDMRRTARLEASRRNTLVQLEVAQCAVADLEFKIGVRNTWTPEDAQYKEALNYLCKRELHKALNKVQHLVVQRLFEMSKANIAGMGYKVRTSIWKHIRTRSKAIRTALTNYNTIAVKMRPPAPALEWSSIVNFSFVSEFDILRHSNSDTDTTAKPWMSPANREIVNKLFKAMRACEEIERLNVELRRLRTFIFSEDTAYLDAITVQQQSGNYLLSAEIKAQYRTRHRINNMHHITLNAIEQLPGFTGDPWEDVERMDDIGAMGGFEEADLQDQCIRMTEVMEDLALDS